MRRSITGTAVGNFMEWYDFGIYGFLATTIAQVFYPGDSASAVGLIATFGTLAAAFAVRPFGGIVFGALGDRIGRKRVLIMTVALMALGTTITGLLPSYEEIGVWAPILLIVTKIMQGFSTGGEYVGAMTYVSEHAPDRSRGALTGFLPLGTLGGYITGAGVVTLLNSQLPVSDMLAWGWRVPFLLGVPLAVVTLILRLRIDESPAFEGLEQPGEDGAGRPSGWQQFQQTVVGQRRGLLICMGLVLAENVTNYMLTGYLPTYFKQVGGISGSRGLTMIVVALVVMLVAVMPLARLSDRIGRKPLLWTGSVLLIFGSVPAFLLIRHGGSYPLRLLGVLLIGVMLVCFYSTTPSTLPALFPTQVRFFAVAIGFNISVSAFGGTTPLVAETLVSGTGNVMLPAYILMCAGVVGAITLWFTPETAGKRLPGSGPSVATEQEADAIAEAGGSARLDEGEPKLGPPHGSGASGASGRVSVQADEFGRDLP
ncbi:MFS transporter [[Mycobacterium] kokjensenii]|uniref:MFS transporter n=1 Tax=[Mycobacterium] kokjensenii TaxID=3064287 RepID=A0ABM9LAQ3_9MYCO|nr:MFS transporter [Mycolicibacter sp. MU0083]CAJ1495822.1 MFS transporter [Mycolicibacter sp. MU0083]